MYKRTPPPATSRHTTASLEVPNAKGEKWTQIMRNASVYWHSFCTAPVASMSQVYDNAEDLLDYAIQHALEELEQEKGCLMRLVQVALQNVLVYNQTNQTAYIVGVILAVPLPHENPTSGPKRKYQVQEK